MQERAGAKVAALVAGVAVMCLAVAARVWSLPLWGMGIRADAPLWARLAHPFVHGGVLHALVNVYVLWQLVFFWPVRLRHLLAAYAVACSCPAAVALWGGGAGVSAVGLSGVLHVLLGMLMPHVRCRRRFLSALLLWSCVGWWSGCVAVGLHLWCFACGLLWVSAVSCLSTASTLRHTLVRWLRELP